MRHASFNHFLFLFNVKVVERST